MKKIKSIFIVNSHPNHADILDYVYGPQRRQWIADNTDLYPVVINESNFDEHADQLADVEVAFSTWGMPTLREDQIDKLKGLKCLFYAAGATPFRQPYLDRGVTVCSATEANAVPVAEFCLAQILLATTGFFRNTRLYKRKPTAEERQEWTGRGNYGARIALIGAGTISNKLQELLKPFNLEVIVVPSRPERRTISLEEAFATSYVVSNHLPNRDDNVKVLDEHLFQLMPKGATFINTGRGRQVDEDALVKVLTERPDLTALLDVQFPEPPEDDSMLYKLPNIQLSTHIAGSKNDEVGRMADYMISDFKHYAAGEPMDYVVKADQL
ncbi:MAG: hydroxyacid dehydrogenase [Lentisphaeria bacterium]|nr:hydroxyacid dehydrogenase [Lentisphaeria bacterium]